MLHNSNPGAPGAHPGQAIETILGEGLDGKGSRSTNMLVPFWHVRTLCLEVCESWYKGTIAPLWNCGTLSYFRRLTLKPHLCPPFPSSTPYTSTSSTLAKNRRSRFKCPKQFDPNLNDLSRQSPIWVRQFICLFHQWYRTDWQDSTRMHV